MKSLQLTVHGHTGSLTFHCRRLGISIQTVMSRHRRGESYIKALTDRRPRPKCHRTERIVHTVQGVRGTIAELSKCFGVDRKLVLQRIRRGLSLKDALTIPYGYGQRGYKYTYKGVTGTLKKLHYEFGVVRIETTRSRLTRGWDIGEALTVPFTSVRPEMQKSKIRKLKSFKTSVTAKIDNGIRNLTYKGETHSQTWWEQKMHLPQCTIGHRLRRGWSVEDAITKPMKKWTKSHRFNPRKPVVVDGLSMTICEHCARFGTNPYTVLNRIRRGWDIEDAIKTPSRKYTTV